MKVRELMQSLESMDQNMEVHIAYNYGDHARTIVARSISGAEEGYVKHSPYHNMDRLIDDEEENDDADRVVVLR